MVKVKKIRCLFWALLLISLLFQYPFPFLSSFISPMIICFIISEISNINLKTCHRRWITLFAVYLLYLLSMSVISILSNNPINNILRFMGILFLIPFSLFIKDNNFNDEWKIFKILTAIKAVTVVVIWLYLFVVQDYSGLRYFPLENGVGDIYIINHIPKVQVLDTSLFVIGFAMEYINRKKITIYAFIMLMGGLAAGMSAYLLGYVFLGFSMCFYYILKCAKVHNVKSAILLSVMSLGAVIFLINGIKILEAKSGYSNYIRFEQANLLLYSENKNIVFGNGVGNAISGYTRFRNYNKDTFFELQNLYIINQIGILGLGLFYILTSVPLISRNSPQNKFILYLTYLIYTFFNPYCFNTTHIIVLLLINNYVVDPDKPCATQFKTLS